MAQTEFPVPTANSVPSGITVGPELPVGALWFTEAKANQIGRITTAGIVSEFPIPTANSAPNGITTGPDGALWFTETGANQIGRITTAGIVSEFPIPTANSNPINITTGPDGALWFTESIGNKIGRVTTVGAITEFPIPTASSAPSGITTGPDGALWFTEGYGNKIGRIPPATATPTNPQITEFTIPLVDSGPQGITTGPDGALWFTQGGANKIGRLTVAGELSEFQIFTPFSDPGGITAGPDGALWFTEGIGKIGRVTTAGVVTEFLIPTSNGGPYDITTGPDCAPLEPDCALWFTEALGNNIGRLGLPALQVAPTTNIVATGQQGGPFVPSSFSYTLSATSESVSYSISGVPNWLTPSSTSGTVSAGTTVTFSVNANANNLAVGTYGPTTITFTSSDIGQITQTRTATLNVNPPALRVTPITNIVVSGRQGGPFAPSSFSYTLSATSGGINYSISGVPNWLTPSSTSGTASTGTTVTFSVNANANNFAVGTYGPTIITFTNSDTGQGTQTRGATLTINSPALQITPATNIVASGQKGGPFAPPSSFLYTLTAPNGTVRYSITNVPSWLTASSTSGTVTKSGKSITFWVNSSADKLAPSSYISSIGFNNATNGQGNTTRLATLNVTPKEYTIKVSASPAADGTLSGGGTFVQGSMQTVTATPDTGHTFVHWTENGTVVSTSENYTFTLVGNVTLVADFR